MTCRHFQMLLRSSVQLVLSNSCSKKYFATSPVKFKLELSNQHDVFYHRLYIASIKNITRLSCTPGLVQKYIFITKNTRNPNISGVFWELLTRFELVTSSLPSIRSELGLVLSSFARMLPIASSCASAGNVMSVLSWQRSENCPTRCSCAGILTTLHSARISKRKSKPFETMDVFSPMKQMIPLKKQSKKAQKEQHAKQRGSWYGISPVTRTVPNGKAYDRNRVKREDREFTD